MIESIDSFPDNVVAVIAKGQVTKQDYEKVLIPKVEAALKRHERISLYYELGAEFSGVDSGAAWEDIKVGVEHLTRWERMAVVTDVDWIRHLMSAFRVFMPGRLRVFPTAKTADARAWILAAGA